MRKRVVRITAFFTAVMLGLAGCGSKKKNNKQTEQKTEITTGNGDTTESDAEVKAVDRETVFQVSLLQGLTFGDYHGSISAAELKKRGDIGIGTFDGLNGEMITLDGNIYRAAADGSVEVVPDDETIPFSNVTFFDTDETAELSGIDSITALQDKLNEKVDTLGKNRFYFIRIDGTFSEMNVRSEYVQKEPYKPLAEVLETDQTFFDYENIEGTVVGLYCPPYMSDLNATGWHLHFVSADRQKGGHILGLKIDKAELSIDITDGFEMALPEDDMFADFDLTIDQSEDIEKVEKSTADDTSEDTTIAEDATEKVPEGTTVSEDGVTLSGDSSDFVLLSEAVPDAILEIRYYSTYNFVGDRIDGYEEPVALLTKKAAAALKEVSDDLKEKGYRLKIFDAYRPQMAVTNFVEWAEDTDDTRMKEYFYPELDKSVLFDQGYIALHSGHSRGSTVDLTLFDMRTEKEVDMGGTFDYFGELSHPDYTDITEEQYANRMILREAMIAHGFRPLDEEWWHFTLDEEPYPDTYFTFPVSSESVE